jgi:MFS family permease
VINTFMPLWQQAFQWSAIDAAVHAIPVGVVCFLASFTGALAQRVEPRWLILAALALAVAGTALFQFCGAPDDYWRFTFPGFLLGSAGAMASYILASVAMFRSTPPEMAGTVGAIFNGGLQVGSAVGYAIVASVETAVEVHAPGGFLGYAGRRAAFRVLLGFVCIEFLAVAAFYRRPPSAAPVDGAEKDQVQTGPRLSGGADGSDLEKS